MRECLQCGKPLPRCKLGSFVVVLSNSLYVVESQFPGREDKKIRHEAGPDTASNDLIYTQMAEMNMK
jgi:hypothetical protein